MRTVFIIQKSVFTSYYNKYLLLQVMCERHGRPHSEKFLRNEAVRCNLKSCVVKNLIYLNSKYECYLRIGFYLYFSFYFWTPTPCLQRIPNIYLSAMLAFVLNIIILYNFVSIGAMVPNNRITKRQTICKIVEIKLRRLTSCNKLNKNKKDFHSPFLQTA